MPFLFVAFIKVNNSTKVENYFELLKHYWRYGYTSIHKAMKKCIYVVEDNAAIRDMIEFLLVEEQYDVKSCPSTNSFWQQMAMQKPDMVILDVMLPDGSGVEICNQLKHSAKTYQIPIMMMSAGNQLSKVKNDCDAEDYINKPFDLNDFVVRIEHHLAN